MAYSKEELVRINAVKSFGLAGSMLANAGLLGGNAEEDAEAVATFAQALSVELDGWLEELGVLHAGEEDDSPKSPKKSSSKSSKAKSSTNGEFEEGDPCPLCEEEGRDGVITVPERGPAFECSLRERKRFGKTYRDVGECDWKDWGDKYE